MNGGSRRYVAQDEMHAHAQDVLVNHMRDSRESSGQPTLPRARAAELSGGRGMEEISFSRRRSHSSIPTDLRSIEGSKGMTDRVLADSLEGNFVIFFLLKSIAYLKSKICDLVIPWKEEGRKVREGTEEMRRRARC